MIRYTPENENFAYSRRSDNLFGTKNISALLLINPDNPTGNYIPKMDVVRLAKWAEDIGIRLIVDESFVDFADTTKPETLLDVRFCRSVRADRRKEYLPSRLVCLGSVSEFLPQMILN